MAAGDGRLSPRLASRTLQVRGRSWYVAWASVVFAAGGFIPMLFAQSAELPIISIAWYVARGVADVGFVSTVKLTMSTMDVGAAKTSSRALALVTRRCCPSCGRFLSIVLLVGASSSCRQVSGWIEVNVLDRIELPAGGRRDGHSCLPGAFIGFDYDGRGVPWQPGDHGASITEVFLSIRRATLVRALRVSPLLDSGLSALVGGLS